MSKAGKETLGYWEVTAIGVGGMVGGGIFAVLGLSVELTGGGAPLAFLIAGIVALVTSYSYARLSVTYPSQGGTVAFLDRAFGSGLLTGSANILLWISYIVMLSLYAYAFGSYGASFFPPVSQPVLETHSDHGQCRRHYRAEPVERQTDWRRQKTGLCSSNC